MTYPCPDCGAQARVSKTQTYEACVRRRHKCKCGFSFGTLQRVLADHERLDVRGESPEPSPPTHQETQT